MQKESMSEWWYKGAFSSSYIGADSRYRDTTETPPSGTNLTKILPKNFTNFTQGNGITRYKEYWGAE